MNIWSIIDDHISRGSALEVNRLPTFYPSSASCINEKDGTPIGACIRMNYYRCVGYDKSDSDSIWSQYVFAGGKIWEQWVVEQLKEAGVWIANNIKFVDTERYISGEVDILARDPEDDGKVIVEVKTFYGYEAKKNICGNTKVNPSPKDSNLLQAMIYDDQFAGQVKKTCLLYFGRDDHSRQQFDIVLEEKNGRHYPRISTAYKGSTYSYLDERVSIEGIYERYAELLGYLQRNELPPADFKHNYTESEIKEMVASGDISKTAFEEYQRNPQKNPLGHFMCQKYCNYRSLCAEHKSERNER